MGDPIERRTAAVIDILAQVGFPIGTGQEFATNLRKRRVAHILMAVAKLRPSDPLSRATFHGDGKKYAPRSRDILDFINKHYGEKLSSGSYDDIRRKNLDFLVAAGLIISSANKEEAAHNDGTRGYSLTAEGANILASYRKAEWPKVVAEWLEEMGNLKERLSRPRKLNMVPVMLPNGDSISLSQGVHNVLQQAIIQDFLPRFLKQPELLYLGDSTKKIIVNQEARLEEIGLDAFDHELLPDVVALDVEREWLFFIEAVHTSNPISRLRHLMLEKVSSRCPYGKVFVTAFATLDAFKKWCNDLSWETEVWISSEPEHMIHFNGDKFLGPHIKAAEE